MSYSPSYIKSQWDKWLPRRKTKQPQQKQPEQKSVESKSGSTLGTKNGMKGSFSVQLEMFNDRYNTRWIIEQTDLVEQARKDEESVLEFMKARYLNKEFYTWAGQTLLATHPYEEQDTQEYPDSLMKPSISALVKKAWFMLSRNLGKVNHCIVITGESGSGKTYSACLAIKYIARKEMSTTEDDVLWKVWSSVPLLTAFGNAATAHNYNSSRFGKLLQLQFHKGTIRGAFIKTYMLEKSRVTGPNENDGNFHIFRQILENLDEETLEKLNLSRHVEYRIVPRVKLRSSYTDTIKSFEILEISEISEILTVLAFVLNLGNVSFEQNAEVYDVSLETLEYADKAASLFEVATRDLVDILCNVQFCSRNMYRRHSIYKSACMNMEECEERRNSLMKFLYNSLFNWLVKSINSKINADDCPYNQLGLLDVYGFEVFDHNTFEQLCINYANERLQQHFMVNHLQNMRDELVQDGFNIESIDISDYSTRISLIDGPFSIFGILNEECAVKRFNDDFFVNTRLVETMKGREHFIGHLNSVKTTFSIAHYTGVVEYDTKSMLQKNRDKVPDDIINFIKSCKFDFLKQLLVNPVDNGKTMITNFKRSLDELMQWLKESEVHYIKCLKPNPYKMSEYVDDGFYMQQLRHNGIFEMLKLNFQKYPIKLVYEKFIKEFTQNLFDNLKPILREEIFVSKTKIYLTVNAYNLFEKFHRIQMSRFARKIQTLWFRYNMKRIKAAIIIQRSFRKYLPERHLKTYNEKFIDLSKRSSDTTINRDHDLSECVNSVMTNNKIEDYLRRHRFDVNYEGDQLSLILENVYNNIQTKPFKRVLFCGDRIVSFNRLAEIPVRFHTSKTCLRYSHLLPKAELPKGLLDII